MPEITITYIRESHDSKRAKLALIIPAHNEEMLIAGTINSAIRAGLKRRHIYVVDDASTDNTAQIARDILGDSNVLTVAHSGKIGAILAAYKYFEIRKRYIWLHVTDADGLFGHNYFRVFKRRISPKYVAATGHLQSLNGGWVSKFRVYEYTIGLEIMRRLQNWFGVITVIPGPTSCFRTDIFDIIDFQSSSLTEDLDATLQIHRRKLGKIGYFTDAKCYTQDPKDFRDFRMQVTRWYRGFWQAVRKYRIGLRPAKIDFYVNFVIYETIIATFELFLLSILAIVSHRGLQIFAFYLIFDVVLMFAWVSFAAIINRRRDILYAFPLFYILRFTNLYLFFKTFFEVMILRKFKDIQPGWETVGRRYRVQTG